MNQRLYLFVFLARNLGIGSIEFHQFQFVTKKSPSKFSTNVLSISNYPVFTYHRIVTRHPSRFPDTSYFHILTGAGCGQISNSPNQLPLPQTKG